MSTVNAQFIFKDGTVEDASWLSDRPAPGVLRRSHPEDALLVTRFWLHDAVTTDDGRLVHVYKEE